MKLFRHAELAAAEVGTCYRNLTYFTIIAHHEGSNIYLNGGYVGAQALVEGMGVVAHIRGCGEEKQEKKREPEFKGCGAGQLKCAIHG